MIDPHPPTTLPNGLKPLLLISEAASILSISREQVSALVDCGALHALPISEGAEREHLRITALSVSHKLRGLKPPTLADYGARWCLSTDKASLRLDELSGVLRCTARHARNIAPKLSVFSVSDAPQQKRNHCRVATRQVADFLTAKLRERNALQ